jgi:hypothetical protein
METVVKRRRGGAPRQATIRYASPPCTATGSRMERFWRNP